MRLLSHFKVQAFRGLRGLELDRLGRVNLVVGGNDSGKTSILEALAIFAAPMDILEWANVVRSRELPTSIVDAPSVGDSLRWLFPHPFAEHDNSGIDVKEHLPLRLEAIGETPFLMLKAECSHIRGIPPERPRYFSERRLSMSPQEDDGWLFTSEIEMRDKQSLFQDVDRRRVEVSLWRSLGLRRLASGRGPRMSCAFLPPYAHRNQPSQFRSLSRIIADDEKSDIVKILQQLDDDVEDVEIVTDEDGRRPVLAIRHRRTGLAPVSVFGDGLRRALMIALSLHQARHGLLLIDEVEAALHVTALTKFFHWLLQASLRLDVQVFATTHSLEAVAGIADLIAAHAYEDVAAYHLYAPRERTPPKRYSSGMLQRLVAERGLDIR